MKPLKCETVKRWNRQKVKPSEGETANMWTRQRVKQPQLDGKSEAAYKKSAENETYHERNRKWDDWRVKTSGFENVQTWNRQNEFAENVNSPWMKRKRESVRNEATS